MQVFRQHNDTLTWESGYETLQIEPWGQDSLRVRATTGPEIGGDFPGALLEPAPTEVQIEIGPELAVIRNGAIAAEVRLERDRVSASPITALRFLNAAGTELPRARTPITQTWRHRIGSVRRRARSGKATAEMLPTTNSPPPRTRAASPKKAAPSSPR